ncbi:MAG: DUF1080 domain-containing protein [Lentisphaeria bacterium]|nr:DUF1080 domain-containing protein [Lentisphaeria bacterium]
MRLWQRMWCCVFLWALAGCCLAPGWCGEEPVSLFDGETLAGWTRANGQPVSGGWVVEEGLLQRKSKAGDLFTAREYADFTFEIEWKVAVKGNSGIKYRFTRYEGMQNGPEYQLLDDDGHPDAKAGEGDRRTACLYDILKADTADVVRPAGEWNTTRIVARGSVVEHWLNGKMVLRYDADTDAFREAVQRSKFSKVPDYGAKRSGRIMLQDHGDPVWFRNIRITEHPRDP